MTRPLLLFGVRVGRWQGIGFGAFCLLAGSRWLVENAWPSALPPLMGRAFDLAVIAMVALAFWWVRREPLVRGWWRICLAGLLLIGLPTLAGAWTGSQAGPALFTLVPLWVVVIGAAVAPERVSRGLMMPALVGAAGGLLVLPFTLPTTLPQVGVMAVVLGSVVVVAAASVWLHVLLRGVRLATAVWLVCGTTALVLGVAGLGVEGHGLAGVGWIGEAVRALVFDLPESFLVLWLVREVRPEQAAARWLLVPLVTIVEGLVLLRPGSDARMGLGLALIVGSGAAMLFGKGDNAPARLGLAE